MLVLGKHSDDKGKQLENLTVSLLKARGYTNICQSWVGPGGEEIDVQGEYEAPLVASRKAMKLICECKAYKAVVPLPDWLKFCGKLYVAASISKEVTHGCFIALSGVNGNVRGSYDQLREQSANIELITGDELLAQVGRLHPFLELKAILARVRVLTEKPTIGSEIAYYEGQVYWLVLFEHGTYTLLKADGTLLTPEEAAFLCLLIERSEAVATYINLEAEAQAKERRREAETAVIALLMEKDGRATLATLQEQASPDAAGDITAAADRLVASGLIGHGEGDVLELPEGDYKRIASVYRALFSGPCPIPPLGSSWYDRHIDRSLLDEIRAVQAGMHLPEELVELALGALQYSPTALKIALQPIDVIVHGREQIGDAVPMPQVAKAHQDYFLKSLFDSLQLDFTNPYLSDFFHVKRGIRELELKGCYILKSEKGIAIRHDYRQRHVHGFLHGMGKRAFVMIALDPENHPEPWESPTLKHGTPPDPKPIPPEPPDKPAPPPRRESVPPGPGQYPDEPMAPPPPPPMPDPPEPVPPPPQA